MDIEATKTAATQLLDSYYQIHTSDLPTQRTKSQWQAENKRGFFLGIIQEGEDSHIIRLHHLLATNQFTQQQEFSTTSQLADPQHPRTFIDDMFAHYILPFHKDYSDTSTCHTQLSSNPPSRSNSADDLDYVPEERELTHKDLKKAVEKRDGVCLFCWGNKFISKEFQHVLDKHDVRHVTVIAGDHNRQSIVERFNRTLESTIAKYQNSRNTNKYIDVLDDIVHNYNHTFHQSIQDIPERKFLMNPNSGVVLTNHFKFPNDIQVGDYVRILKEKKQFQKGYADNFSRQIYHVIQGNGYTLSLQDENGHGLDRKYKYYELSKVTNVEKYLNRQADREKPLTNQQKRNRREIEELLEHTVEPLEKKRKIIS
jgi:hypothetical protein